MQTLEAQIIEKNLNEFNQSIRDEFIRKRINDTGEASDSLRIVSRGENTFASVGSDYIEVLDKGRGAGKFAPVQNIQDWVRTKLGITDDKEVKQIAFLVNRKIKNEGTAIFKDNSKGLEIDAKIEVLNNNLVEDLRVFAIADVKKQLNLFQSQRL